MGAGENPYAHHVHTGCGQTHVKSPPSVGSPHSEDHGKRLRRERRAGGIRRGAAGCLYTPGFGRALLVRGLSALLVRLRSVLLYAGDADHPGAAGVDAGLGDLPGLRFLLALEADEAAIECEGVERMGAHRDRVTFQEVNRAIV